jgi:1,4-alpha-glucan branching enzyme
MSVKKQFLKKKPVCKVTFRLNKDASNAAKTLHVAGDFNGWDEHANPMKKLKNGDFTVSIDLDVSREYQFRYLKDGKEWITDFEADKRVPTPFGDGENSVVIA